MSFKAIVKFHKKKITIYAIKILIGILSFWFIYSRLAQIPGLKHEFKDWFQQPSMYLNLFIILLLMPVNWGIESYKWKLTTAQTEEISYSVAVKSVMSGIFAGNIAPGRAIEFLAKIVFFKIENRPQITILHFINGMFQMLITVVLGLCAIVYKLNTHHISNQYIYLMFGFGIALIMFFCWAILNVSFIQNKLRFISWFKKLESQQTLAFSKKLVFQLILLSVIRYVVFTGQFFIIYTSISPQAYLLETIAAIAAYFMLTSLIPMISYIEPAIRAAIALFVFNNSSDNSLSVIMASTFVWIINVVIPSIIGYVIIFKEKIEFKNPITS